MNHDFHVGNESQNLLDFYLVIQCLMHTDFGIIFGPDNLQSNVQNADEFREWA